VPGAGLYESIGLPTFPRRLPGRIGQFVERRISIWVEIPDRDPAFRWVQAWLAAHPYAKRARDLSLSTTWVSAELGPTVDTDPRWDRTWRDTNLARYDLHSL
jgi:hypothetical protein